MAEGPLGGPRPFGKGPLADSGEDSDTPDTKADADDAIQQYMEKYQGGGYKVGRLLKLYQFTFGLDEEIGKRTAPIRDEIDEKLRHFPIESANPNITPATTAGAVVAAVVYAGNDYLPMDLELGADANAIEEREDGTVYEVLVDAPTLGAARFYSMYEAGTGFTSLFLDKFEIQDMERVKKRIFRDTWRVELIERPGMAAAEQAQAAEERISERLDDDS